MTPQAVEFIVEACVQHEGPIITTDWRDVARLAVRMTACWIVAKFGGLPWPDDLPQPLLRLLLFNQERGTLDAPTWPETGEKNDAD